MIHLNLFSIYVWAFLIELNQAATSPSCIYLYNISWKYILYAQDSTLASSRNFVCVFLKSSFLPFELLVYSYLLLSSAVFYRSIFQFFLLVFLSLYRFDMIIAFIYEYVVFLIVYVYGVLISFIINSYV